MSTMNVDMNQTVGELVAEQPGRSRVFERFGIDYCCGGKRTLRDACQEKGLDCQDVQRALATVTASSDAPVDWTTRPLTELADHIEQTHHAYLRRELPRLGQMVRKVAAVHGECHPWMLEVDGVFAGLAGELDSHMMKEEQVLFPLIRAMERDGAAGDSGCGQGIGNPVAVMEHEHDDAGRALERMRELSSDYTPPAEACNTFRAVLDGLRELEQDMHQHVHKENNILFPRAMELERQNA